MINTTAVGIIQEWREHGGLADFFCGMYTTGSYLRYEMLDVSGFSIYGTFNGKVLMFWFAG